jgi:hypothetical protein
MILLLIRINNHVNVISNAPFFEFVYILILIFVKIDKNYQK